MKQSGQQQQQRPHKQLRVSVEPSKEAQPLLAKDAPLSDEEDEEQSDSTLLTAFLAMIVFSLGNRLFGKLETYPMYNYPFFLNIMGVFIYVPICFLYIWPMQLFGKSITKEQMEIPKYQFFVMGFWDAVAGTMQTLSINYITNASMLVLLQQSAIPISMLISKYFLNARYTVSQYIGAMVVCMGIVVVLIPAFSSPQDEGSGQNQILWSFVMVVSCIPMCLSSVYKEQALGEVDVDVVYLNGWVAVFQFICSVPMALPIAWAMGLPISDIPKNTYNGWLCWLGISSVEPGDPSGMPPDDCAMAPFYVSAYLAFNIVYNILIVVVIKYGGANLLFIASTVMVPIGNVAFSFKFVPGNQPLTIWDVLGLVFIMLGLVLYRFYTEIHRWFMNLRKKPSRIEEETERRAKRIERVASRKMLPYMGLSQAEYLQGLIDTRIVNEQKSRLFRSPQQIRGNLLARLGIPPSPSISIASSSPGSGFNASGRKHNIQMAESPSYTYRMATIIPNGGARAGKPAGSVASDFPSTSRSMHDRSGYGSIAPSNV